VEEGPSTPRAGAKKDWKTAPRAQEREKCQKRLGEAKKESTLSSSLKMTIGRKIEKQIKGF